MPISELLDQCSPREGAIRSYLTWAVEVTHAPQCFHLGAITAAVSYEAARRGLTVGGKPFRFLCCLVAGPGSAKSTAKNRAREFVQDWYNLVLTDPPEPYITLKGSLSAALDLLSQATFAAGPAVGTTPVIFDLDEVSMALRYGEVEDVLSELYDGGDYKRNLIRLKREGLPGVLHKPRVQGVFCGTQSSIENSVTSNQIAGGLFSRILFLKQGIEEKDLSPNEPTWPEGRDWALQCWATWKSHLDVIFDTQLVARDLQVSDEARGHLERTLWPLAKRNIVRETREAASMVRLGEHAKVVAGAFALSEAFLNAGAVQVDPNGESRIVVQLQHMERAVAFITNVVGERGQKMEAFVEMLAVDPVQKLVARLAGLLETTNGTGLSKRQLYSRAGKPSKFLMDQAIQTLLDSDQVAIYQEATTGRPRSIFALKDHVNSKDDPIH